MKTLLRKRLLPLALSLALLAGLLAIPAAAAPAAPTEELADITYYGGSYTNCKMPYDMANAYVQALDSLANNGTMATLADPAGDGMPLLLTVDFQFTGNLTDTLKVWTWNGISAMPYDFVADTEVGWTFGYDFGTYDGREAALRVGDGVGLAVGDATADVVNDVAELGANECTALARLNMLEFNDRAELVVVLDAHAITEIGGRDCHVMLLQK